MYRGVFDRNWYTESKAGKCIDGIHPNDAYNVELMQYTGLKDKNSVEIYEGDILHSLSSDKFKPMLVNFNDCCFSVRYLGDRNCRLDKLMVDIEDLAVIGNIYENPELLEK